MNTRYSKTPLSERLVDRPTPVKWEHINWKSVEHNVNKLQTRIVKAVRQHKWHLVKRLQYLLTHSFSAKLLAVKRVTQNKGKRTAGIDGEKWTTPNSKMKAVLKLSDKKYKAKPLRRMYISKHGTKKKRPLSIPTMYDRAMQSLYSFALNPIAETTADTRSFGFRKNRSAQDARSQLFLCLSKRKSAQWILEGDIKGCFDNINHKWLSNNIPLDKSILNQFLKAGFVYNRHLNPTKAGTAQGGIISPTLANMTLDGIEDAIASKYHTTKKETIRKTRYNPHKVNFVRYADDFIVTADSEEVARDIADIIRLFLEERGLELSLAKTLITHIDTGFDFLGWNFRKYNGKLLIKPSYKSIATITKKISNVIKNGKALPQYSLIKILNPIIVGWREYHRSAVSKETFSNLDFRLWNMLWTWAKRRHPNKSHQWIANKYWNKIGSRKWVFSVEGLQLKSFADAKIIRHPAIKLDMNPYTDKEYFKLRSNFLRKQKQVCYTLRNNNTNNV